jgi:aspartyl-tRNA(Asn)/glutamyl-tRNA(Gln) amidotransferase subunit C
MSSPSIDVSDVAYLARIQLSPEETALFQQQLGAVLEYVNKLKEADISGVQLQGEEADFNNNLRPDVESASLPTALALRSAPAQSQNLFSVPRMVE